MLPPPPPTHNTDPAQRFPTLHAARPPSPISEFIVKGKIVDVPVAGTYCRRMEAQSAELYDAIYTRMKDYGEEAEKVPGWIEKVRPGAHAKHLSASYQIAGIDLNQDFLAAAQRKIPGGRFQVADMTDFDLGQTYDAVVCLFSSIGYVLTVERLNSAIRCMSGHLAPQGVLIVEPWFTPEVWRAGRPHLVSFEEENLKICRMNTTELRGERTSFSNSTT